MAHRPIVKAYADTLDLGGLSNYFVPTEMDVDAGPIGLGLVWATLSGRSPRSRLEECLAHHATELRWGTVLPAQAVNDDTVGRVLARLYDMSPRQICTAWAVRAAARVGVARRDGHVDTTSRRVWGADPCAEAQDVPCRVTYGSRKEKRPDRKPCVLSPLGIERPVPIGGKPQDGHASDQPRTPPL